MARVEKLGMQLFSPVGVWVRDGSYGIKRLGVSSGLGDPRGHGCEGITERLVKLANADYRRVSITSKIWIRISISISSRVRAMTIVIKVRVG